MTTQARQEAERLQESVALLTRERDTLLQQVATTADNQTQTRPWWRFW